MFIQLRRYCSCLVVKLQLPLLILDHLTFRTPFNTFIDRDCFINCKTTRYQSLSKTCLNKVQGNLGKLPGTLVMSVSNNELKQLSTNLASENCVLLKSPKMTAQKKSLSSFASVISILSIVLYCAGFLRIELELNKHKERLNSLENVVQTNEQNIAKVTKNVPGKFVLSNLNY